MSYLALARKYRPRIFEEVVGQGHVTQALQHALAKDRLHPAILLTGTRGVGKTTLARIVAKGLNCETGVSANPCGVCGACKELDQGRFVDMLEIDAASNTGVDDVRVLIENAQYSPARGRYKVYLIDEVHMLSKNAFNALLKTLEEPPPHVKFILATTDPQKLLVTVLSRCLQFNLKRLPQGLIREQVGSVLQAEGQAFEPAAITEIARAADGSMRDALSLTDQAIAFAGGGALQREPVEQMLGTSGRRQLIKLLQALAEHDAPALGSALQQLEATAPDYAALLNALAGQLQRLALLQLLPGSQTDEDEPELLALVAAFKAEDLQLYYQMAVLGRRDMTWAPDARCGFEMTLLRMLAFSIETPEPAPRAAVSTATPPPAAATPRSFTPRPEAPPAPRALSPATPAASPTAAPVRPVQPVANDAPWLTRINALGLGGMARQLALNCLWQGLEGTQVRLTLDQKARHLLSDSRQAELQTALSQQLGYPITVSLDVGIGSLATPAAELTTRAAALVADAQAAITDDPVVLAFAEHFGAVVRQGSVKPS